MAMHGFTLVYHIHNATQSVIGGWGGESGGGGRGGGAGRAGGAGSKKAKKQKSKKATPPDRNAQEQEQQQDAGAPDLLGEGKITHARTHERNETISRSGQPQGPRPPNLRFIGPPTSDLFRAA